MTECLPKVNESTRQNRDDKTFFPNSIVDGDLPEKQLCATECFVEPCPNLRIESEFRKCKMIPIIHPDEWISHTLNTTCLDLDHDLIKSELVLGNITGDTALLSQQVINKEEVLRDSVNTLHLPKESSVEMKIKTRMKNKKRKAKAQLSQSCKINKDIEKPE